MSKSSTPSVKPLTPQNLEGPSPGPQANGDRSGRVQSNPHFRTAYSGQLRVPFVNRGESRTKQSFKDECDINVIMKRYLDTGSLDHLNEREARYLDVTGIEYRSAMELVAGARSQFESLPSSVRSAFKNDPAEFLEFMEDPDPADLDKLGLLKPEAVQRRRREAEQGGATPLAPTAAKPQGEPQAKPEAANSTPSLPLVNKQ